MLSVLLFAAIVFAWKVYDPLGVDRAMLNALSQTSARVVGTLYPYRLCSVHCSRPLGRDQVVVATFDEEYRNSIGDRRNTIETYARVITRLVADHARAIVFDILIDPARFRGEDIGLLAAALREASAKGVPVIVAQLPDSGPATPICCPGRPGRLCGSQAQELICNAAAVAPAAWASEQRAIFYPLYVQRDEDASLDPSPAWAAFLQLVHRTGELSEPAGREKSDDILLAWGEPNAGPAPDCMRHAPPPIGRIWSRILPALHAAFAHEDEPGVPGCSYLPRLSVEAVLRLPFSDAPSPVAGRVVFVGIDERMQDIIDPPVGGRLPGIFLHATALDNLLTLGVSGHYVYRRFNWLGFEREAWFGFFAVILLWTTSAWSRRAMRAVMPWSHHRFLSVPGKMVGAFVLLVSQTVGLCIVGTLAIGLSLIDAIDVAVIVVIVEQVIEKIGHRIEGEHAHDSQTDHPG